MHEAVLAGEVMTLLAVREGGTYVDATVGSGGHALRLLERVGPSGLVVGIDRDAEALERTRKRLSGLDRRFELAHGNFANMETIIRQHGVEAVDGIVMDLGVSSEQLELPGRGFSFQGEGPLDMRMDQSQPTTAADLVDSLGVDELADLIRSLGEDPRAGRIARAIVRQRKRARIGTTRELAEIVSRSVGGRRGGRHPATRTFQALRMRVNGEMESLEQGLPAALNMLATGGRMAVITFHSLEDRVVKHFFAGHAGRWESLQAGGQAWRGEEPKVLLVNRKPVTASQEETESNPRARSAKLRVAQREKAAA